jgi:hypothetical protein
MDAATGVCVCVCVWEGGGGGDRINEHKQRKSQLVKWFLCDLARRCCCDAVRAVPESWSVHLHHTVYITIAAPRPSAHHTLAPSNCRVHQTVCNTHLCAESRGPRCLCRRRASRHRCCTASDSHRCGLNQRRKKVYLLHLINREKEVRNQTGLSPPPDQQRERGQKLNRSISST